MVCVIREVAGWDPAGECGRQAGGASCGNPYLVASITTPIRITLPRRPFLGSRSLKGRGRRGDVSDQLGLGETAGRSSADVGSNWTAARNASNSARSKTPAALRVE